MLETNRFFRNIARDNPKLHSLEEHEIVKIQKTLLGMMEDVDYVCRKYHLTYFLCGGSALGAVRHQGFVPWDDDMDITMPRKDYDRLGVCLEEEFPGRYWVQNLRCDAEYDLNFMKIRKQGTRFVELFEPNLKKAGVFVDIFPLEDTYAKPLIRTLHGYLGEALLLICSCVRLRQKEKRILPYLNNSNARKMVQKKAHIGGLFSWIPLRRWLCVTERVLSACHNDTSAWVSIPSGRKHYFGEMYSRASFFPPKEVPFENHMFFIMNRPEEHLKKMYGNYMDIPPEEKREKHFVLELDT